jgi:cytochrome c
MKIILNIAVVLFLIIWGNLTGKSDVTDPEKIEHSGNAMYFLNSFQPKELTGMQLYSKYCLTCHQTDGTGVRGMFPPLAGNDKVTGAPAELIRIVLFGLQGPVKVNGRDYNQPMPPQGYLSDKQIADILNFIRNNWGNKAPQIKPETVGKERKSGNTKTN